VTQRKVLAWVAIVFVGGPVALVVLAAVLSGLAALLLPTP
jgi:hypothetical protein